MDNFAARCPVCREARMEAYRKARKRREVLVWVLLGSAFACAMTSLYIVGYGVDYWIGWVGLLVAYGLILLAHQAGPS